MKVEDKIADGHDDDHTDDLSTDLIIGCRHVDAKAVIDGQEEIQVEDDKSMRHLLFLLVQIDGRNNKHINRDDEERRIGDDMSIEP